MRVGSRPRMHAAEAPCPYPATRRSPRWGAVIRGAPVLSMVILAGTVASCSSTPPAAPDRSEARSTLSASASVTTSPPAPRAQLEGTAHVEIMDASETTFDVPLCQCSAATILPPPEGELNLTWQDRVHSLGLNADPAFLGTKKTTGPVYLIINFLAEGQAPQRLIGEDGSVHRPAEVAAAADPRIPSDLLIVGCPKEPGAVEAEESEFWHPSREF